ncbi:hypothetical protein [Ktedonobacter racemifer]|uniref:Uncharacterized protein n=1 Tax=Ktedonobacter racemifer DSM 44963 TaxID=485913 RepID=D6U7G7_KTERA|nr:hypothetical protein [Ktedonobacter racemifer]EFH79828.1 hypothetical protein Krac_0341 [Ktedonobacter racemifer DSM 44963]
MSTVYLTQATYKGTPHSSPCLKGQGHPAAVSVNIFRREVP